MGKVTKKKLEKYGWVQCRINSQFIRHPEFAKNGVSYCTEPNSITSLDKLFIPCRTMKQLKAYVLNETGEEMQKVETKKQLEKKLRKVGFVDFDITCLDDYLDFKVGGEVAIRVNLTKKDFNCFRKGEHSVALNIWASFKNFKDLRKQVKKLTGIDIKKKWKDDKAEEIVLKDQSENGKEQEPVELPKKWEDIEIQEGTEIEWLESNGNLRELKSKGGIVSNSEKSTLPKGLAAPMLATCQLLLLRDVYRQGWKPDWNDGNQDKFCIFLDKERLKTTNNIYFTEIFTFQDAQTRDLFLDNFKPLLQEYYKLYN